MPSWVRLGQVGSGWVRLGQLLLDCFFTLGVWGFGLGFALECTAIMIVRYVKGLGFIMFCFVIEGNFFGIGD